jgi:hypothetical protein
MDRKKRLILFFFILGFFALNTATQASAGLPAAFWQTIADVQEILLFVGGALGAAMIAWDGVKWITADSPAEREDAKRGVIYVMIGLVLLKSAERIINFLIVLP